MLKLSLLTAFCTSLSSLVFAVNMAVDSSSSKHSPRLGGHWGHSLCCAMSGVEACAVGGGCGSPEARVCSESWCLSCSPWIAKASPNDSVC